MGLPVYLTRLVGRAADLDALDGRLAAARLVSLVGSGGVGKTRLAVEAARRWVLGGKEAVFVNLADLPRGSSAGAAVAFSTSTEVSPGQSPVDAVVERFDGTDALLVLDNSEHLAVQVARLVQELLGADGLTVLTTSRELLGIPGEVVMRLEPLPVPPPSTSIEDALRVASIELMVDRLRASWPDRPVSEDDGRVLVALARVVDGLPLGLELAAARAAALGLREAGRLSMLSPNALGTSAAGLPDRHRSLGATIDWSVRLLSPPARDLLVRCGVLSGSGSLDMMSALVGRPAPHVVGLIDELVRASLLSVDESTAGPTRYRLLEPVRQHQAERLRAEHRDDEVMRAVLDYCVALARRAEARDGTKDDGALDWLADEYTNAVAAVHWAITTGEVGDDLLDLLLALYVVGNTRWASAGDLVELYEQALDLAPGSAVRRSALARRCALLRFDLGRHADAESMIDRAIQLAQSDGDELALASAREASGILLLGLGRLEEAERRFDLCEPVIVSEGAPWLRGQMCGHRATLARHRGRLDDAMASAQAQRDLGHEYEVEGVLGALHLADLLTVAGRWHDALALASQVEAWSCNHDDHYLRAEATLVVFDAHFGAGDLDLAANALGTIALTSAPSLEFRVDERLRRAGLAMLLGDLTMAWIAADDALVTARSVGKPEYVAMSLSVAGQVALASGEVDRTSSHLREGLGIAARTPYVSTLANILDSLTVEAVRGSDLRRAHLVGAAVEHLRSTTRCARARSVPCGAELSAVVDSVRPAPDFFEPGSARLTSEAHAFLLATTKRVSRVVQPVWGWESLTPSELAVAGLVADGLRNREIAERLYISHRTVESHLAHAFTKLGVTTRTQLAAEELRHRDA